MLRSDLNRKGKYESKEPQKILFVEKTQKEKRDHRHVHDGSELSKMPYIQQGHKMGNKDKAQSPEY